MFFFSNATKEDKNASKKVAEQENELKQQKIVKGLLKQCDNGEIAERFLPITKKLEELA